MALLSTFAIVGCRRRLAVAEAPRPQPSSNKFETVFGSNGALLDLGIIKASFASALDFRYRWLPPKIGCRRSPYASTVLEQVRDGIRLKRGFAWSRHNQSKLCFCSRLSLSLYYGWWKTDGMDFGTDGRGDGFSVSECLDGSIRTLCQDASVCGSFCDFGAR